MIKLLCIIMKESNNGFTVMNYGRKLIYEEVVDQSLSDILPAGCHHL